MTTNPLGVLLVAGKETHQENYAAQFQADTRCRLVAVTDEAAAPAERIALNQALAADLAIPYLPDLAEALQRTDVDLVSVCAEPERRGRILIKCAQAGKHLYIDKPMTPYLETADEIIAAVDEAQVRSQMFSLIHQPWVQHAKKTLDSGELGDLVAIHADCLFAKGPAGSAALGQPRQAVSPPQRFTFVDAKAELYALGVYALGIVCWLSQRPVNTVYGHTANYFFEAHQRHNVEDFGYLMLCLGDGITATITGGRMGWASHPDSGISQVVLIGTRRTLRFTADSPRLEVHSAGPPWTPPPINPRDPMGFWQSTQAAVKTQPKRVLVPMAGSAKSDESHFIDAILENRESDMPAHQAAYLTEVLLAGYQSAATHEVVTLPLEREQQQIGERNG